MAKSQLKKPKPSKARATKRKAAAEQAKAPKREGSKQSRVIQMLRAPGGATVAQLAKAFGWQPHTVRGFFAGALKKKLGLKITSEKAEGGERVYRIA